MNDLKEKMQRAIMNSSSNAEAAEKCAAITKEYTLKLMDRISSLKDKDGDRFYISVSKTRMAIQAEEI
jgi:hypothetical protein